VLEDWFGRIEDLLSHTAPPEVLQAIHDAFQNVIEHLPPIDLPTLPDLSHLWHEAWTPPVGELHEPVNANHGEPSDAGVGSNAIGSKPQPGPADPGPTGLVFSELTHDPLSAQAHASHNWLILG
jgi:hypothetical protein